VRKAWVCPKTRNILHGDAFQVERSNVAMNF